MGGGGGGGEDDIWSYLRLYMLKIDSEYYLGLPMSLEFYYCSMNCSVSH